MSESETAAALRRAGKRALIHLARAAVEGLKAIEVVVDELGSVGRADDDADGPPRRVRIDVE